MGVPGSSGKLAADGVQGGTFTITNPGLFGTVFSTPVIKPPEAAILAVCRIAETPVVWNGPFDVALRQALRQAQGREQGRAAQGREHGRAAQGRPEGTRTGGQIVVRLMTHLCLSYDHRIVDGETAIKFLQHMRASLEAAKFEMG